MHHFTYFKWKDYRDYLRLWATTTPIRLPISRRVITILTTTHSPPFHPTPRISFHRCSSNGQSMNIYSPIFKIQNSINWFISILNVSKNRMRLSAEACLQHKWLAQAKQHMNSVKLPTDRLKKFIIRRKWQVCDWPHRMNEWMNEMNDNLFVYLFIFISMKFACLNILPFFYFLFACVFDLFLCCMCDDV